MKITRETSLHLEKMKKPSLCQRLMQMTTFLFYFYFDPFRVSQGGNKDLSRFGGLDEERLASLIKGKEIDGK